MKNIYVLLCTGIVGLSFGCAGPTGPGGAPGAVGPAAPIGPTGPAGASNRYTAGIVCSGTITGLTGNAGTALNGLVVKYKAYVTNSGDVMAAASVAYASEQNGDTQFYSSAQVGASTGAVSFVDDFATANYGYWDISTNRSTSVVSVVYTDSSLGAQSPVSLSFVPSACTSYTF